MILTPKHTLVQSTKLNSIFLYSYMSTNTRITW